MNAWRFPGRNAGGLYLQLAKSRVVALSDKCLKVPEVGIAEVERCRFSQADFWDLGALLRSNDLPRLEMDR